MCYYILKRSLSSSGIYYLSTSRAGEACAAEVVCSKDNLKDQHAVSHLTKLQLHSAAHRACSDIIVGVALLSSETEKLRNQRVILEITKRGEAEPIRVAFQMSVARWIKPRSEGRKLHLCSRQLARAEPSGGGDVRDDMPPPPQPPRTPPSRVPTCHSVPLQHSSHTSQPSTHTQHMHAHTRKTLEACFHNERRAGG